jgi:SAM-dependent methyltransferase
MWPVVLILTLCLPVYGQIDGEAAYVNFLRWRAVPENARLTWRDATERYTAKLTADGMRPDAARKTMSIIASRDEAALYDPLYAGNSQSPQNPTALLVEAVEGRRPGKALDVAMGQGRNTIFLARQGWDVTGFDVSRTGIAAAQREAKAAGLKINAVVMSDEEFPFGQAQWDLIAIVYPIEKRSVYRVREALRPGGIVVVECGHKDGKDVPFEYDTNELLRIFDGFRIRKYEDAPGTHEWMRKELRLVRLIAEKQH